MNLTLHEILSLLLLLLEVCGFVGVYIVFKILYFKHDMKIRKLKKHMLEVQTEYYEYQIQLLSSKNGFLPEDNFDVK